MSESKPQQLTLETLEDEGHSDAPAQPAEPQAAGATAPPEEAETGAVDAGDAGQAAEPGPTVIELTNGSDGCWKVLAGGERVTISDDEWQQELTRLLKHRSAPTSAQ